MQIEKYILSNYDKVKINSNDIVEGDVFIALQGKNIHGNSFIKDALKKGAKFIITEKRTTNTNNIIKVNDVKKFLLELAKSKRQLFKGEVIAITGSIGKTSVKENLKYFLSSLANVSSSIKSYNNYLGVIISILNMNLSSNFAIFEIGTNNFNEIKKLSLIVLPSQSIITNIYPTHLKNFLNTKNIAIEKSDIFYNSKLIKLAILPNSNKDEKLLSLIAKSKKIKNVITFGKLVNSKIIIVKNIKIENNLRKIIFKYEKKNEDIILSNDNFYKINNILICYAIFKFNNLNIKTFKSLALDIPLVEGRGLVHKITFYSRKITFIDESYNASPESMKTTINYFSKIKIFNTQKKYLILGDMKELGENSLNFHIKLLNQLKSKKVDHIIICGELMKLALKKIDNKKILKMDINTVLKYLKSNIISGDILLIKGSNTESTNNLAKMLLNRKAI